ncbi:pentatricopeptide repeat-containing protein At2g33680-like [Tasmannia lanceolata]|uniref:pentatricopeptide repeat-containing protein At2g33680-like n=1 Tax=Tasmannia lanceolata TaxID=3420 RepID=UPI0040639CEB
MILMNRLFSSPLFQRQSPFSIPNCRNLLVIDSKENVLYRPRKTHITNITQFEHDKRIWFNLQHCVFLLQDSGNLRDLNHGRSLHSILVKTGFVHDVFIQNNILRMYVNCGDLISSRILFDEMPEPNLVSWTTMISSFIKHGYADLGLELFSIMCHSGLQPNEFGFSLALKACRIMGEFEMGKLLHGCIIKCGFEFDVFCSTSVLDIYVKCGDMNDARILFEGIPSKCEALWNTLIDGYVRCSDAEEAVELFHKMQLCDVSPSGFTYTILMKLCVDTLDFDLGRFFHGQIIKAGFENFSFVGGTIVELYAKWGVLNDACKVFWNLEGRDNVVWSTLLAGFHQSGDAEGGLNLWLEYISEGYKADPFTFAIVFNLCSDFGTLELGSQVHCSFTKSGFVLDSFVGSATVDMYISFGMISHAYKGFVDVTYKNEICFNAMISGFAFGSDNKSAINLFSEMRKLGLMPNSSTLNYILGAYANLNMLEEGKILHSHILKTFGESDLCIGNALIDLYAKCRGVDDAVMVFKGMYMQNEFSWTAMMYGYSESERYEEALQLFHEMHSSTPMKPSQFTLVVVLQACSKLGALNQGKQTHDYIIKLGFQCHAFVESALIGMYANSSNLNDASRVFSNMSERDLVSWSSMITAHTQHGHGEEALKLFSEFRGGSIAIDDSILATCLSACASLSGSGMGKWVHSLIIKTGFEYQLHVGCAIIDMYCKCGSIEDGRKFFNKMREHNVVSWTAMVSGYAIHGFGNEALELFSEMKEAGFEPDSVTFIGVLTACSHVGFVKEGWHYFESIRKDYGLEITVNHYACMVDLLGRAGHVDEAEVLINKAPFQSKSLLWKTLLGACRKHGNVEVGNRIAEILVKSEPNDPSTYVLLSNIYASASMWDHSIEVRSKMKEGSLTKDPGCSWMEIPT